MPYSQHLSYRKYPRLAEGELAMRSYWSGSLHWRGSELELNRFLLVGKGEKRSHAQERDSLLCDVLEAVFGAVYLDGGFAEAERVILRHLPEWDGQQIALIDAKSTLQEHFQQIAKKPPVYSL